MRTWLPLAWRAFRGGWRPALGWSLSPAVLYAFVVGPALRRPADAHELTALVGLAAAHLIARTVEKTRGLP